MPTTGSTSKNVGFLMLSQACFLAYSMTFITFSGLAGKVLADDPAFATIPLSITLIMTALTTGPISMLMQKYGRKRVFLMGLCLGVLGAALAAAAVIVNSYLLFAIAAVAVGPFQASAQYYRFAASESVETSKAPRAISLVLLGGLGAALLTPTASGWFSAHFAAYGFAGAFLFAATVGTLALVPLVFYRNVRTEDLLSDTLDDAPSEAPARPLREIMRQPGFAAAVANGALGYAMMTFVMTATPLAMEICGFATSVSANVISAHAVAMFLPSLFTGRLIERFGLPKILLTGHVFFVVAFLTALSGITLGQFSVALIALGIGWNFCFIGGTTLLTTIHQDKERGRVQGLNEMLVFGASAIASVAAGAILRFFGWETVNQAAFVILVIASVTTLLWVVRRQSAPAAQA